MPARRPGNLRTEMAARADIERPAGIPPDDPDLRDEHARRAARPGWYAAIVVLDVVAILAFIALVVIPRLT